MKNRITPYAQQSHYRNENSPVHSWVTQIAHVRGADGGYEVPQKPEHYKDSDFVTADALQDTNTKKLLMSVFDEMKKDFLSPHIESSTQVSCTRAILKKLKDISNTPPREDGSPIITTNDLACHQQAVGWALQTTKKLLPQSGYAHVHADVDALHKALFKADWPEIPYTLPQSIQRQFPKGNPMER